MGGSYSIGCRNCDYSKEFLIGVGMMYSPESLLDFGSSFSLEDLIASSKIINEIKTLIKEKNATMPYGYGHSVYRCSNCGEFYSKFYAKFEYDGGSYQTKYKCSKCKIMLEDVLEVPDYFLEDDSFWKKEEIKLEKYDCPKCGKKDLYQNDLMNILWD